jgi:hypothetical protein
MPKEHSPRTSAPRLFRSPQIELPHSTAAKKMLPSTRCAIEAASPLNAAETSKWDCPLLAIGVASLIA